MPRARFRDACDLRTLFIPDLGNQREQVGYPGIEPELGQQRGDLAAVMGLVVEEVLHQETEAAGGHNPAGVPAGQRGVEVLFGRLPGEFHDDPVDLLPGLPQLGKIMVEDLLKGNDDGQRLDGLQGFETHGMAREPAQPDDVPHQNLYSCRSYRKIQQISYLYQRLKNLYLVTPETLHAIRNIIAIEIIQFRGHAIVRFRVMNTIEKPSLWLVLVNIPASLNSFSSIRRTCTSALIRVPQPGPIR